MDEMNLKIIEAIKTIVSVPGFNSSYDVVQFVEKAPFKKGAEKKIRINIELTKQV